MSGNEHQHNRRQFASAFDHLVESCFPSMNFEAFFAESLPVTLVFLDDQKLRLCFLSLEDLPL